MEHTKTPYKAILQGGASGVYEIFGVASPKTHDKPNEIKVATISYISPALHLKSIRTEAANAQFIVKACNAHEELVEVVARLKADLGAVLQLDENGKDLEGFDYASWIKAVDILAKLED